MVQVQSVRHLFMQGVALNTIQKLDLTDKTDMGWQKPTLCESRHVTFARAHPD
jgi:hypothetical protein